MLINKTPSIRFAIIKDVLTHDNNLLNISWLCDIAGVSRSGYYTWLANEKQRNVAEEKDKSDFALILDAYSYRGYDKGVYGIYARLLRHHGIRMNQKKIRRLMHKYSLICPIRKANPYRRAKKALQTNNIAENLVNRELKSIKNA